MKNKYILLITCSVIIVVCYEMLCLANGNKDDKDVHKVKLKSGNVVKNNKIDKNDDSNDVASPLKVIYEDKEKEIALTSKTFIPPDFLKFYPFKGDFSTHVDVHEEPSMNKVIRLKDKSREIKILLTIEEKNAGVFPLRAEGNLRPNKTPAPRAPKDGDAGSPWVEEPFMHWSSRVSKGEIDIDIYHGVSGDLVPDDKKNMDSQGGGAFTVVNLNDTNQNMKMDNNESDVKDEIDLMKIVIKKPNNYSDGDEIIVTYSDKIKLWKSKSKGKQLGNEGVFKFKFNTNEDKYFLWAEAVKYSDELRDIKIEVKYKERIGYVLATAVWCDYNSKNDFRNSGTIYRGAQGMIINTFKSYGSKLGMHQNTNGVMNAVAIRYKVYPDGIHNEPNIKFDITRRVEVKEWGYVDKWKLIREKSYQKLPHLDHSNDEGKLSTDSDEDNVPNDSYVYSIDAPGTPTDTRSDNGFNYYRWCQQANFQEYVRVKIHSDEDKVEFDNSNAEKVIGSRVSDKAEWYSRIYVEADNKDKYKRVNGKIGEDSNSVGIGNKKIEGPVKKESK